MSAPLTGCINLNRAEWRNWRVSPSRRPDAAPPYWGSPQIGWPIAAMWARIWCVRPVSSRTRRSVVRGQASSISKWVRATRGWSVRTDMSVRRAAVAPDRRVDRAGARVGTALHEREVLALELALADQLLERAVDARRTSRPPSAPRCRGRAGGRCPAATDRARRPRGPRAPGRASRSGARAPGAPRRRPACRRPAGGRPRARPRTARPRRRAGRPGRAARAARPASLARLHARGASAARRRRRSRHRARSAAGRRRASRPPRAPPSEMSSRSPAASGGDHQLERPVSAAPPPRRAGRGRRPRSPRRPC